MKVGLHGQWVPQLPSNNNKKCKTYFYVENKRVYFSGDFDSGNLERVEQLGPYEYRMWSGYDHPTITCSYKSFFHFKVTGFFQCRVRFHICRANLLNSLFKVSSVVRQNGLCSHYRPVYRLEGQTSYRRIAQPVKMTAQGDDDVSVAFQFMFNSDEPVYFAFSYPYSYGKLCHFLEECQQSVTDSNIYFHKEVLTLSNQHRKVHLVTVTSKANCLDDEQDQVEGIFQKHQRRALKIKPRPTVLVTARVHPGQTSASFCFQGLLRFLLDKQDYRAYLLRKYFHFLLIPMLNPDGVHHGMYRMDLNFQNLNRVYYHCNPKKEPSIWAVRQLVESMGKVDFFFDLHGHASKKGFFVYGNAFEDIHLQTESELFAKLLELNSPYFQKSQSNFSKKQMKAKDRADQYTKQGCARVFMYRRFNIIHSYTLECGFHTPNTLNILPAPKDPQLKYLGEYKYTEVFETEQNQFYTPVSYMNLGKAILISLLDVFDKNPYSRIYNSEYKSLENLRKTLSIQIYQSSERFRIMDPNCLKKLRQTNDLIKDYYNDRFSSTVQEEQPVIKSQSVNNMGKIKLTRTLKITRKYEEKEEPKEVEQVKSALLPSDMRKTLKQPVPVVQALMRETSIWSVRMSKEYDRENIMQRRKASLKNFERQKVTEKIKGIRRQEKKEAIQPPPVVHPEPSNGIQLQNYSSAKQRYYEEFLTRRVDNFKNFIGLVDKAQLAKPFNLPEGLPRLTSRQSTERSNFNKIN